MFYDFATMITRLHPLVFLAFLQLLCLSVLACGSTRPAVDSLPPQTLTPNAPSAPAGDDFSAPVAASSESVSALDLADAEVEVEEDDDPTLVVVGDADDSNHDEDASMALRLYAASRREAARRDRAAAPVAVITDKNLAEMAEGGRLTVGGRPATTESVDGGPGEVEGDSRPVGTLHATAEEELYWRSRARELRERWRDAYDSITILEGEANGLRRRFYSEDDPWVRDARIKPAWDRSLDKLEEARDKVEAAQDELADFLDEGRRAGALPGWLREGNELEPDPSLTNAPPLNPDPQEPQIAAQPQPPE